MTGTHMLNGHSLYTMLRCPYCKDGLAPSEIVRVDQEDFGILKCRCSEYPVVAGIPVIRKGKIGSLGDNAARIIDFIRAGKYLKALLILSRPPAESFREDSDRSRLKARMMGENRYKTRLLKRAVFRWDRSAHALLVNRPGVTAVELLCLYYNNKQANPYDYFRYRFSQPRHLVALSLANIIQETSKPVLDVGCGFGHITRGIYQQNGGCVIGIDSIFFVMLAAKRTIAPRANYVCCDANIDLPFHDDAFSAAFSSNVFHFIDDKSRCLRELYRVTGRKLVILASLRHSGVRCETKNSALSQEDYQKLMADIPHRIVLDGDILDRYLHKQGPALAKSCDRERLINAPFITMVASENESLLKDYDEFQHWPHEKGHLGLNPLYCATPDRDNRIHLTRILPSKFYMIENKECEGYLSHEIIVRKDVLSGIDSGKRTPEIADLIDRFVVLDIPVDYG